MYKNYFSSFDTYFKVVRETNEGESFTTYKEEYQAQEAFEEELDTIKNIPWVKDVLDNTPEDEEPEGHEFEEDESIFYIKNIETGTFIELRLQECEFDH